MSGKGENNAKTALTRDLANSSRVKDTEGDNTAVRTRRLDMTQGCGIADGMDAIPQLKDFNLELTQQLKRWPQGAKHPHNKPYST